MISIVYAYEPEVKFLKQLVKKNKLQSMIGWHKWPSLPDCNSLFLNVGFVGGLNPDLALGQVVLVGKIIAQNKKSTILNSPNQLLAQDFAKGQGVLTATLLTVKNPITDILKRDELRQKTKADVVDMEGHYLYALAEKKNRSVISLKIVSDNADNDTWQTVRQNRERWSKILGERAMALIKYIQQASVSKKRK